MKTYRLPNGNLSTDEAFYVASWTAWARPMLEAFGWEIVGFNPHIQVRTLVGAHVTIPLVLCDDILTGLRKLNARLESAQHSARTNGETTARLLSDRQVEP